MTDEPYCEQVTLEAKITKTFLSDFPFESREEAEKWYTKDWQEWLQRIMVVEVLDIEVVRSPE